MDRPVPITGYAQVGMSGLARVQTSILPQDQPWPVDDPYFMRAEWTDTHILPPPEDWGGKLPGNELPPNLHGFDPTTRKPREWPLRLTMAHWATLLPAMRAGNYTLRCRSIDAKGFAQPMPRPFPKSGRNGIEEVSITIEG